MIAQCATRDDVRHSVEFARRYDLPLAIRAGGHSFAGHGVCDDGIVIDLSLMKRASIDPSSGIVAIEAGILAHELDYLTQAFSLAVPLGSCPAVGVTGYALGGGEGALTPKFGYACDNIMQVEIITADGQLLHADKNQHQDLFWAVRGAGANFGVVVSLAFQAHPVQKVLSGHFKYSIRQAAKVLAFIKDYAKRIPDDLFLIMAVLPHPGERMLDISVMWPGPPERGIKALRPLRKFLKPFQESIEVRDYLDEQRAGTDSPGEGDFASCRRGGHLEDLNDEAIAAIVEHASNSPSEASGITIIYWHGPWSAKQQDNAFGFRRTGYEYWIHSYWRAARERSGALAWVEAFFAAMTGFSTGAVYVNDLENEGEERVRAAYGDKYERLQQIKGRYDPDNLFCVNQNIRPRTQ
ncbi:MAG TPA: FAD-dependent oxidoreductase [Candidatus Binataceae bacterium]|nr:FAD-dependent oxidoreductase [Candidatus Binataceae bacterium]